MAKQGAAWHALMRAIVDKHTARAVALLPLFNEYDHDGVLQQVTGDLLWAAGDKRAHICYEQAIRAYEQVGDDSGAQGVREHLKAMRQPAPASEQ